MDPERWRKIKDAFAAALDLPPEERAEWLSFTLPDDPSLAREVKSLLAAHEGASDFYEQGALAAVPEMKQRVEGAVEGMRVGPYRVLSELGHGGMGAVYLAVRDEPKFTQKVALKLIKRGMDTDEIVRRFVAERQILASLAHPNIARLFDGGSTPDGRPYFVMEYVEGQPITAYAAERKLPVEERLRLFLRVCRAVQSAHQSLVVHRDLKPANILVDAEGEPKLLDFGIAKLLDPSSFGGMTALTGLAPGPMTPDYASPEQRAGGPVTTATDVYGLGLLLYELLVGHNPRAVERQLGAGWADRPPSQAILALAEPKDAEARRLARRVSGDLDTIVGKALEPEPERRYGTVAALAEDIERHLTQRPVTARRPTLAYRLGRTLVRRRLAVTLGLVAFLIATAGSYFWSRVNTQAETESQRAEALAQLLRRMIQRTDPKQSRGRALMSRQILDAVAEELLTQGGRQDLGTQAAFLEAVGNAYENLDLYEDARKYLARALRLRGRKRSPGRDDRLAIAGTWTFLGDVDLQLGNYPLSRDEYQRAIAIRQGLLGMAAVPLVHDWNGLGNLALEEGKWEEARRYFARSFSVSRRAEDGQRELAETLVGLGRLKVKRLEYAGAQLRFQMAWHYLRSTLGDYDLDTVDAQTDLAAALENQGDYARAETLYQEIVDLRRRVAGPDHPDLPRALLDLALTQQKAGHLVEARASLNEELRLRREHQFPADDDEAASWDYLGHVGLDQNQLDAAEAAFQKSLAIYRSLHGEHRSDLARTLTNLAQVHRRRADLAGALSLARQSLELRRAAEGKTSPSAADGIERVAELLQQDRQFRSAEEGYRQAMALLSRPAWKDLPEKARVLIGLGSLLVETGRAGEARPLLEKGWGMRSKALPVGDPDRARADSELGTCYAALGDRHAEALLRNGYQVLLTRWGPKHPDTRQAQDRWRRLGAPAN